MRFFLGDAIFWVAVACCVVAEVAIVRSALVVRFTGDGRRETGDGKEETRPVTASGFPSPVSRIPSPRWSEVAWTILPAIALAIVLAVTWRAVRDARVGAGDHVPVAPANGVVS